MTVIHKINTAEKAKILTQLQQADKILVGVGAGFAAAAGLEPLPLTQEQPVEQYWTFWRPYIEQQRFCQQSNQVYDGLLTLLRDKDYFIVDSNPDGMVYRSGVELSRIYKVQGDMARVQCSKNCSNQAYAVLPYFRKIDQGQRDSIVCPKCGAPLQMNVYTGPSFCQAPYEQQKGSYFRFINRSARQRLVVLELGIGYTMPELLRFPFEHIVHSHRNATLIRINTQHPLCMEENKAKAICIGCDAKEAIAVLTEKDGQAE